MARIAKLLVIFLVIWCAGSEGKRLRGPRSTFGPHVPEYLETINSDRPIAPGAQASAPVVLVDPAERRLHLYFEFIAQDLRAADDASVRSIVSLACANKVVGKYSNGQPAYQPTCSAKVFDRASKALVAAQEFAGGEPPKTVKGVRAGYGMMPIDDLNAWLRSILKPAR